MSTAIELDWLVGVFRPLKHATRNEFVVDIRGARMSAGLCGSFTYTDLDPTDYPLARCPDCLRIAQR